MQSPNRRLSGLPLKGADTRRGRARQSSSASPPETISRFGGIDRAFEIERQLEPLWRDVLQLPHVEPLDNFFDLGGNSLMAVRLFAEVADRFGVKLPLSSLFRNGTIAAQARLLMASTTHASHWSPIVPIQPSGSRPPFFLVHGIGGEVLSFAALAQHLGNEQPIFGLQSGAPDTHDDTDTIESVAARYVTALRAQAPIGPYLLGGYSAGGAIAYEMAQQLRSAGEDVALLAMLDASAPRTRGASLTPRSVWRLVKNVAYWPIDDEFLRSGWTAQRARLRAKVKAIRVRGTHSGTSAALAAGTDVRDLFGLWQVPDHARTVSRALRAHEHCLSPSRVRWRGHALSRQNAQPDLSRASRSRMEPACAWWSGRPPHPGIARHDSEGATRATTCCGLDRQPARRG